MRFEGNLLLSSAISLIIVWLPVWQTRLQGQWMLQDELSRYEVNEEYEYPALVEVIR